MSYYENFNKFGEKIAAIQEDGQTITYHELEEYTKKIKALIPSRSLVVNFCKNAIGSMVNYLSFLNARKSALKDVFALISFSMSAAYSL